MFTLTQLPETFNTDVVLEFNASTTIGGSTQGVPVEQTFRLTFAGATLQQVCELAAKEVIIREQAVIRKTRDASWQANTPVVNVLVSEHKPSVRSVSGGGASVSRSISALVRKAKAGKLTSAELSAHSKEERMLLLNALEDSLSEELDLDETSAA